jgi:hypothetical protein
MLNGIACLLAEFADVNSIGSPQRASVFSSFPVWRNHFVITAIANKPPIINP